MSSKIIGMIRYSVASAFAKDHPDKQFIAWEDPYFTERLNMFKSITLPSLAKQTDMDFTLFIYHSDLMPNSKKQIFFELEKEYPFIKNIFISGGKISIPDGFAKGKKITFRIDNDDALPSNFIERMRSVYNSEDDFNNTVITIPKIRKLRRISEDEYQSNDSLFVSNSIGLAYLSSSDETVMDLGNHRLVPYTRKTFFLDGTGGLQLIHGTNVANGFNKVYDKQSKLISLNSKQMNELLKSEGYIEFDLSKIPLVVV